MQTIEKSQYLLLKEKLKACPMFIYPVKRNGGHFSLVGQAQDNIILFAHLNDFKNNGILTTPMMVLVFFEELLETKNLCLARCDITDKSLSKEEASRVYSQVAMFYATSELYERFVVPFNRESSAFNYNEYTKLMDISKY